jgi:hypothetical protein
MSVYAEVLRQEDERVYETGRSVASITRECAIQILDGEQ